MPAENEIIEIDYHQLEQGDTVHVTLDEGSIIRITLESKISDDGVMECQVAGLKEFDGLDDEQVMLRNRGDKYYLDSNPDADVDAKLWVREECCECRQMRWTGVATLVEVTSPVVTPEEQQTWDEITS